MKLSLNWIKDFVDLPADLTPDQIAYDLTMTSVEVEGYEDLAQQFAEMVVGRVETVSPHPNADRLRLCSVDIGAKTVKVVCGGSNLSAGMSVAMALPGSRVRWHGEGELITLTESEVRGEKSYGMICGADEINLTGRYPVKTKNEIVDLTALEAKAGTPLADALGVNDVVFEIDNKSLTNRPDLWGHYGIARELAAIYCTPLKPIEELVKLPEGKPQIKIDIKEPRLCKRYTATSIEGVHAGSSPAWVQQRLMSVGQRPINLLVDLTNYVMFAVGQPTHVFDRNDISDGTIVVRKAEKGETLVLLDNRTLELGPETLLIADPKRALALAGVMGGKDSSVTDRTTSIVLESACFAAVETRRTASALGIRTDSSMRFEKGIDCARTDLAVRLFLKMLKEIQPGASVTGWSDVYPNKDEPVTVVVGREFIVTRIGKDLTVAEIKSLLERLGYVAQAKGEIFTVEVPTWRATGDVSIPADIVEEVARLFGYDNLEFVAPPILLTGAVKQPAHEIDRRMREFLVQYGRMVEVFNYPWVDSRYQEAAGISGQAWTLQDPPSPETAEVVRSLIPNLLSTVERNIRNESSFGIFEVARVFEFNTQKSSSGEALPNQPKHVGAMVVTNSPKESFYQLKGTLESLFRFLPIEPLTFSPNGNFSAWASENARTAIYSGATQIGELALVADKTLRKSGLTKAALAAVEFDYDQLKPLLATTYDFHPIPKFPQIRFDLSMFFEEKTPWDDIATVTRSADALVKQVSFIDEYRGEQVPPGKRSIAFQFILGNPEKTLTSEDMQAAANNVMTSLEKQLGAERRLK